MFLYFIYRYIVCFDVDVYMYIDMCVSVGIFFIGIYSYDLYFLSGVIQYFLLG